MSQTTLTPEIEKAEQQTTGRTMLAVALVSFASLLLELAMTRLFSVILFYHFAFFAISVALLGLGAGGVFAHVRSQVLKRFDLERLGSRLSLISSIFVLVALEVVLHTPVSLEVNGRNFARLTVIYLVTAIPFFFTGLLFSVLFARRPQAVSLLYGADLTGGAAACLLVVPLLNRIGAPNALLFASAALALASALWTSSRRARLPGLLAAALFGLLIAANYSGRIIDVVYAKGILRDSKWIEFSRWNAISRIEVDKQDGARYIVIDADATSAIMNVDPADWDRESTATPTHTGLPSASSFNWKRSLMSAAPALANVLRPHGSFAIIGPGGGVDVLRAVANGSPDVTGIEINPIIVNDIMRGRYSDYSFHLYDRPQVHIHTQDGRSFIRGSSRKYDVVQMTLVDTWASTAAGAFALSENNLYTVNAFREYFEHLQPDGMIAITRWEFREPREALRVVSQGLQALHQMGVSDPRSNFIVVADGNLDQDGRPVLVLARRSPFTNTEYQLVAEHIRQNPNLVWLNPPHGYEPAAPLPAAADAFTRLIQSNDPKGFARGYSYNVSPVDDEKPFFFFTLKTGYVLKNIFAGTGRGMDWRINLGIVLLGMLLLISVAVVAVFLILPLMLQRSAAPHGSLAGRLYFIALGLGYIMTEISMIQRFVLFLGHPTYALTVVVFFLLLGSGAGSLMSRRWISHPRKLALALIAIGGVLTVYVVLLPRLLPALVGLPFLLKFLLSALLILPGGVLMGLPFPAGIRLTSSIEWAWALNASASVLGSILAMIIAIHFGLTVTLLCAVAAYLSAAAFSRTWRSTAPPA